MKHKKKIYLILFCVAIVISTNYFFKQCRVNHTNINLNEVPYISTYYINPIIKTNEDAVINFYITDYNQMEYKEESSTDTFTVTVKINGKKDIIKKRLKAGDNSINIGSFHDEGEQYFSIICTDQYGRNSHELFNSFLVSNGTKTKEYIMKESDLAKYNIDNSANKKNALKTREGIQKLLDDKKKEGYNSLKLLKGTYVIDHTGTIYIPTEFTLNLNKSTIKLKGFTGDSALMITLNNTFNSHVINGTIEGDYSEHDYENSPNNSEWVNGISIDGESKYSSFENLTVKNITGYGAGNGIANSRDNSLEYTYLQPTSIGDTFSLGDIDRETGEEIKTKKRSTSDYINISGYNNLGYLSVSRYLGYQGNPSSTWNIICHYYNKYKKYIKSIDGYQYRNVSVPQNASYLRVTILDDSCPSDLSVQLFRIPTNCSFKNITFDNCRCVGLAMSAMKNMLVENCEFINCGQSSAKCALDCEDGWDMMQDVTFRRLNFHDNPNDDFLTCAGHNFIVEDMIDGDVYIWERTNSYVIRNCNNLKNTTLGNSNRARTGYTRFYNNIINGNLIINSDKDENWKFIVKNSSINGRCDSLIGSGLFYNCNINKSLDSSNTYTTALGTGEYINCTLSNKTGENQGGKYTNCNFKNITGNMHGTFDIANCTINNWNCYGGSYEPNYKIENSILNNFQIQLGYWHQGAKIFISDCTINNKDFLLKLPQYAMKENITLKNNTISSNSKDGLVYFYDDRTGNQAGDLCKQKRLTLENNSISLPNSNYIVTGIDDNTINNINIADLSNKYDADNLQLCNSLCYKNKNINIKN